MPFALVKHKTSDILKHNDYKSRPIQITLLKKPFNLSLKFSQRLLIKDRITQSNLDIDSLFFKFVFKPLNFLCFNKLEHRKVLKNADFITKKYLYLALFVPKSRGLKPIFECDDFVVFDKPSKVLTYPVGKNVEYCMLDELRAYCGDCANFVHRLDYETSGLLVGAKNNTSEVKLKKIWQERKIVKKYLALIKGELKQDLIINSNIAPNNQDALIKVKMRIDKNNSFKNSKTALTYVKVIKNFDKNDTKFNTNTTLVEVDIKTGRQHQIRVHLASKGFAIMGDTIYMADDEIVDKHLRSHFNKEDRIKYFGNDKMLLQCNNLEFVYKNIKYQIYSKQKLSAFLV